ncbi:MAG: PA1136 family autoinducer-binding transcriptional regulator [Sphingobium sp.]
MDALTRTVTAIERGDTLDDITSAVRAFATPHGYDRFVLYSSQPYRDRVIDTLYWVEGDWFGDGQDMDAEIYLRRCPVNQHILETDEPFFWTKSGRPGKETYRVVRSPHGTGIHGFQVPIFGTQGLKGAASFGGRQIDSSLPVHLSLAQIAGIAFRAITRMTPPERSGRTTQLSAREREVMRWMAAGKRQAEAALLLGLSERTIENHLRRIRGRLGASTTAEALRIAIRSGEITA